MINYVEVNHIDMVLVTELSRLGRDTLQVLEVIEMLNGKGISLYIQNCNIETLTKEGKVNAMSQFLITIFGRIGLLNSYQIQQKLIPVLTGVFEKFFKENSDINTETRRLLLKSQTECKAKLEKLQIRYGLGEISDEVHQTTYKHLNAEIARIHNLRYSVEYQRVISRVKQSGN